MLTPDQVRRIHDATDAFGLNRQWVVVPLATAAEGRELVLPDGKVFIAVPAGAPFEGWISGLPGRLAKLNLVRTPKADHLEAAKLSLLAESPPGSEGPPFTYTRDVKQAR